MTYNIQLAKLISLIHQAECTVKEVNSTDSAVHNQFLKKKNGNYVNYLKLEL